MEDSDLNFCENCSEGPVNDTPGKECSVCGYVYRSEEGDPDSGIIPGTDFNLLPENWECPICASQKNAFKDWEK